MATPIDGTHRAATGQGDGEGRPTATLPDVQPAREALLGMETRAVVLLVGSGADVQPSLKPLLRQRYTLEVADDGAAVAATARVRRPDLVLVQAERPDQEALALVRACRVEARLQRAPILLVTASPLDEAEHQRLAAETDDYVAGAFSAGELFARVDAQLKIAQVRREAERREQALRAEVQATKASLEKALMSLEDHFVLFDREWRYLYVNDKAAEVLRLPKEQLLGRCIWELFPDAVGNLFYQELHRAVAEQRNAVFDHYYEPFGRWYENRVYVSPDGVAVFSSDATERKQAEAAMRESEARFRAAIEGSPSSFFILQTLREEANGEIVDFTFVDLNTRGEQLIGIPRAEAIGGRLLELLPANRDLGFFDKYKRVVETGQALQEEFGNCAAGHVDSWFWQLVVPLGDGIAITTSDVTERKQAEQEREQLLLALEAERTQLRLLNDTLEQRVAERTRELGRANHTLEQRNRELQDFAYAASHDLQEPLRKFRTFLELLHEQLDDAGPQVQDYIQRMGSSTSRMSELITALLALSRVSTRSETFLPTDLGRVVEEVLVDLEVSIAEAEARVKVAPLCTVQADPLQMRQLFQNLIGNALKFRRPDVPVVVRITSETVARPEVPGTPSVCRITVADNGIGFDDRYQERIFAPFQRLHGRSAYPGTGMGLAICRRIAERHGGSISAHSKPGEGSTFVVELALHHTD